MQETNREKLLQDAIENDIDLDVGMIAYRKYLWALKYIEEDIASYEKYEKEVLGSIQHKKSALKEQRDLLKAKIEVALDADSTVGQTKSGGKSINLPDIGSASVSGYRPDYKFDDENLVMKQLGKDFIRTKEELMKKETRDFLKENALIDGERVVLKSTGEVLDGIRIEEVRTFRVTLK